MRGFRDNTMLKTFAGQQFINVFYAWYYSFSPSVAAFISTDTSLMAVTRGVLYPLFGIMQLGIAADTALSFNSELGTIVTIIMLSSMIGLVYFTPITIIPIYAVKKSGKSLPKLCKLRILLLPWIASISMILLAEITLSPVLMMAGTGALVVSTIALVAGTIAFKLAHKMP